MTTLEQLQNKARELIQDPTFLCDDTRYSCHIMRDSVVSSLPFNVSSLPFNPAYQLIEELGDEFRVKLLADPIGTFGFELNAGARAELSDEEEPCTAFVHTSSQLYNGEYCTERMTAVRTAWLQFIIDYEE